MKLFFKVLFFISLFVNLSLSKDLNINLIEQKAKTENKQVMFFFHIPSCPYCERMLKENFKNKEVLKEINKNFVLIDIFTGDKGKVLYKDFKGSYKEFAKSMKVFTYPTTQFRTASLKLIHQARGYRNSDEYMTEIKYITTKAYKNSDLETFSEEWEFSKDD